LSNSRTALRRIALHRRVRPFPGIIKRATNPCELSAAHQLVYETHLQEGYILPTVAGRFSTFDSFPGMPVFIGVVNSEIVGAIGMVADTSAHGLPSDWAFRPELDAMRTDGSFIVEVTGIAIRPDYRRTSLLLEFSRACWAQASLWGADVMFTVVSPKHVGFYRDVLHFHVCGDPRNHSEELVDIVQGMVVDCHAIEERLLETDRLLGERAFLHDCFFRCNPYEGECLPRNC
jgi:hypothetical protein